MTPMPSFEFCAFRFLAQWEESECALYNAIRSAPTEKDIHKALSYFQVARNFEGLKEAANAAFILQSLLGVRANQALASPTRKCINSWKPSRHVSSKTIFHRLRSSYGFPIDNPTSFTVNRAVAALRDEFGHRFEERPRRRQDWPTA
jgi:hypothetical protein